MMKKTFYVWTLLLAFGGMSSAYADFEAVETTLGKLEGIQKEAQNVQEELKKVQSAINSARQGDFGPLKEVKSGILNDKKVKVKMVDKIAEKIKDSKELEGAVESTVIPAYTNKNQNTTYFENKEITDAIRRENLSRIYAYALTLRTNMDKTRKEGAADDKTVTAEDSREILESALTKEAMENARRVARIWDMQASVYEFELGNLARQYSNRDKGDDQAEDSQTGGNAQ